MTVKIYIDNLKFVLRTLLRLTIITYICVTYFSNTINRISKRNKKKNIWLAENQPRFIWNVSTIKNSNAFSTNIRCFCFKYEKAAHWTYITWRDWIKLVYNPITSWYTFMYLSQLQQERNFMFCENNIIRLCRARGARLQLEKK